MSIPIHYVIDIFTIIALTLGVLGSLYTAYNLMPSEALRRITVAATLGLMGAFIAGFTVGLPTLNAIFSPHPGILSFAPGVVFWLLFWLLFLFSLFRSLRQSYRQREQEKAENAASHFIVRVSSPSPRTRNSAPGYILGSNIPRKTGLFNTEMEFQNFVQSAPYIVFILLVVISLSVVGWGKAAFYTAPQRGDTLVYVAFTIVLGIGGIIGGAVYGYRSPSSDSPPSPDTDIKWLYLILVAVILFLLFGIGMGIVFQFTQLGTFPMPIFFRIPIYIFIAVIPILTVATVFASFVRRKVDKLSETTLGKMGIWLILAAFSIQLLLQIVDIVSISLGFKV